MRFFPSSQSITQQPTTCFKHTYPIDKGDTKEIFCILKITYGISNHTCQTTLTTDKRNSEILEAHSIMRPFKSHAKGEKTQV